MGANLSLFFKSICGLTYLKDLGGDHVCACVCVCVCVYCVCVCARVYGWGACES